MIDQLFKTEGASIFSFKPGDVLIRVESMKTPITSYNENLGVVVEVGVREDSSYRRDPVRFIGIENNLIYVQDLGPMRYVARLLVEEFQNGWALFKLPPGLTPKDLGYTF